MSTYRSDEERDLQVSQLTRRVYNLEQEVQALKHALAQNAAANNQAAPAQQPIYAPQQAPVQTAQPIQQAPIQTAPIAAAAAPAPTAVKPAPKQNSSIENKIGEHFMAILASALIVISLVLFTNLTFQYVTDPIKAVIIFAISIAIAAFGLLKMKSKKDSPDTKRRFNTFFTALAGTGVSAVYVSILVSYFGLKVINVVGLAIMIVLWLAAVIFIARTKSRMFAYICNVGLIISAVLAAIEWNDAPIGIAIYAVTMAALYWLKHSDRINNDAFIYLQIPAMSIVLSFLYGEGNVFPQICLFVVTLAVLLYPHLTKRYNWVWDTSIKEEKYRKSNATTITIFATIIAFVAFMAIFSFINVKYLSIIPMLTIVATCVVYYIKHKDMDYLFTITYIAGLIASFNLYEQMDLRAVIGVIPYILLLPAGIFIKNKLVKYTGVVALLLQLTSEGAMPYWVNIGLVTALGIAFAAYVFIKEYHVVDKWLLVALLYGLTFSIIYHTDASLLAMVIILSTISILLNLKYFSINPVTKAEELPSFIISLCINAIGLPIILVLISGEPINYAWYFYVLFAIALFSVNVVRVLKSKIPIELSGVYTCLKYTVLIIVILAKLDCASYVISIAGLLIAITAIALGFLLKFKSFRLYGLVLSMIAVLKLLIFDIQVNNSIFRPIGIFLAGILCFTISFIYTKLEKQATNQEPLTETKEN